MAGAGKKTFTAGETLTASDVNNYLMDQSVMVFGGTAARSSAIPTPSEGMFAVTTDNDELDYYDGSAWVPALPVGAWISWSPVLSGGWLNGNGTWTASYAQIGKTVVANGVFTVGSTTTKGTIFEVSLPVTAKNTTGMMSSALISSGATSYICPLIFQTTSTARMYASNASATYLTVSTITATVPLTWATGDLIRFACIYEAA